MVGVVEVKEYRTIELGKCLLCCATVGFDVARTGVASVWVLFAKQAIKVKLTFPEDL